MRPSNQFLKITGLCGIIAGLATFLLWLLPWIYGSPATLEAHLALHDEPLYIINLWISFLNIFFIVLASWGLTLHKLAAAPGSASTGMLFLLFYAVAELLGRSTMVFVREYGWTARLQTESDPTVQASLLEAIQRFDEIFGGFFVLLLICFIVASFCFGLSTWAGTGLERWVSVLLFSASLLAFVTLGTLYVSSSLLQFVADWGYPLIQPLSRLLIGVWLWRLGSSPLDE